ncbi:hypothetical protein RLEG12_01255 (plasmid) [Rhizobium leguminosarum bv. trifolii CB782]|nr:hypothetical protein RLEG12_01255 [Rhizobium leguminosarum bv. trifolii CB782]
MVVSQATFCDDVLERFDHRDRSVSIARKPLDDLGDKIIEMLEQSFGIVGSFCHDRRSSDIYPPLLPVLVCGQ